MARAPDKADDLLFDAYQEVGVEGVLVRLANIMDEAEVWIAERADDGDAYAEQELDLFERFEPKVRELGEQVRKAYEELFR